MKLSEKLFAYHNDGRAFARTEVASWWAEAAELERRADAVDRGLFIVLLVLIGWSGVMILAGFLT